MTEVKRILSWGTGEWLTVVLACDHRRKVRRAEAKAEQLMVGKMVKCAECEGEAAKPNLVQMPRRGL